MRKKTVETKLFADIDERTRLLEMYRNALIELENATDAFDNATDYFEVANARITVAINNIDAIVKECKERKITAW